jgi:hypothetical protein
MLIVEATGCSGVSIALCRPILPRAATVARVALAYSITAIALISIK